MQGTKKRYINECSIWSSARLLECGIRHTISALNTRKVLLDRVTLRETVYCLIGPFLPH